MMFTLTTMIFALIGVGILILYFANTLDKENHFLMVLLCLFMVIGIIILIPKTILEKNQECSLVIQNATLNTSSNATRYDYIYYCDNSNTSNSAFLFYRLSLWFARLFSIYVFLYLLYIAFMRFTKFGRNR